MIKVNSVLDVSHINRLLNSCGEIILIHDYNHEQQIIAFIPLAAKVNFMIFRKCIVLILLLAIGGYSLRNVCIMVSYEINKKFITEVLCENRDIPEMKCFGKCQLSKRLREAKEKESSNNDLLKELRTPVLFVLNSSGDFDITETGMILHSEQPDQQILNRPHLPAIHPPAKKA